MRNQRSRRNSMMWVLVMMLLSTGLAAAQSRTQERQDWRSSGSRLVEGRIPDDGCDDPDADHGKKMKCKHQKLANVICATSDLANNDPGVSKVFNDRQKQRFARQCEQSQVWANAPDREEDFRQSLKKRGAECYLEEILDDGIGDDDGICTKAEQHKNGCAEVLEDNIGDDDGICQEIINVTAPPDEKNKKSRKRTWEACIEVCDLEEVAGGSDDDLVDNQRAEMLENALDESAETLRDLNSQLVSSTLALQAEKAVLSDLGTVYDPPACLGLLLFKGNPQFASPMAADSYNYDTELRPFTYETLNDWRLAANYVQAGEICENAFAYSWSFGLGAESGGSTQAWCIVAHYADSIVKDVADGLELLDDLITGTRVDNMAECLQYIGVKVQTLEDGINEANAKLEETLRLLNLPAGRRPDWPGCNHDGRCNSRETLESCPQDCRG